jgi:hypothetical protein
MTMTRHRQTAHWVLLFLATFPGANVGCKKEKSSTVDNTSLSTEASISKEQQAIRDLESMVRADRRKFEESVKRHAESIEEYFREFRNVDSRAPSGVALKLEVIGLAGLKNEPVTRRASDLLNLLQPIVEENNKLAANTTSREAYISYWAERNAKIMQAIDQFSAEAKQFVKN